MICPASSFRLYLAVNWAKIASRELDKRAQVRSGLVWKARSIGSAKMDTAPSIQEARCRANAYVLKRPIIIIELVRSVRVEGAITNRLVVVLYF